MSVRTLTPHNRAELCLSLGTLFFVSHSREFRIRKIHTTDRKGDTCTLTDTFARAPNDVLQLHRRPRNAEYDGIEMPASNRHRVLK